MTYVVTQPCCNDASCVAVCPVNCIHPTPDEVDYARTEMLYIDPIACIDCGACADACPIDAVLPDYDLDEATEPYLDINAGYYEDPRHRDYPSAAPPPAKPKAKGAAPIRVAIVGTGPAACYAGEELLTSGIVGIEVHFFERLPTPWGLVRFGVAPDHQQTKSVIEAFARTAGRKGAHFHLNVEIGEHLSHDELLSHFHAVVYAVGASVDRRMGIPGEDVAGSHAGADFVRWYNGHPDAAELEFDFSGDRAVVVGNGNVALDVARILTTDEDTLRRSDIAEHALAALAKSNVKEVVVLGRRGPQDAAFTTPELLGLAQLPDIDVVVDPDQIDLLSSVQESGSPSTNVKMRLLSEMTAAATGEAGKRIVFRFLSSPAEVIGDDRVTVLRTHRNELVVDAEGDVRAHVTDVADDIECSLVIRSIGYRGSAIEGLPFEPITGTLPNDHGRVRDPATGEVLTGVYTAGWIKRGPSGSIGNNNFCAQDTVKALLDDHLQGKLRQPASGAEDLLELLSRRQPEAMTYADWKVLDQHERATARDAQRARIKLVKREDMLELVRSAR